MRSSVALLLLAGCAPSLTEGAYTCGDAGTCPPGWSCHYNGFCYSAEEVGEPPYSAGCSTAVDCATSHCATGPDATSATRFCSAICTSDADCTLGGRDGYCIDGSCVAACGEGVVCPEGLSCYLSLPDDLSGPPMPERFPAACHALEDPMIVAAAVECDRHVDCPARLFCLKTVDLRGVCVQLCRGDTECPSGHACVNVQDSPVEGCLRECATDADCGDMLCVAGPQPLGGRYCVHSAWAAIGLPLPRPSGMMP